MSYAAAIRCCWRPSKWQAGRVMSAAKVVLGECRLRRNARTSAQGQPKRKPADVELGPAESTHAYSFQLHRPSNSS
jgi:hypothetical protein